MTSVWSGCAARGYVYFSILLSFSAEIWPTLQGLLLQTPVPKGERQIKHQRDTVTTMQIKVCRFYLRKARDSVRDWRLHTAFSTPARLSHIVNSAGLRCIGWAAGVTAPQVAIEILYSGGELLWQNTPGSVKHALTASMKKKNLFIIRFFILWYLWVQKEIPLFPLCHKETPDWLATQLSYAQFPPSVLGVVIDFWSLIYGFDAWMNWLVRWS